MQELQTEFNSNEVSQGVFFKSENERPLPNTCLTCGQDFATFKECIQCCADIE